MFSLCTFVRQGFIVILAGTFGIETQISCSPGQSGTKQATLLACSEPLFSSVYAPILLFGFAFFAFVCKHPIDSFVGTHA